MRWLLVDKYGSRLSGREPYSRLLGRVFLKMNTTLFLPMLEVEAEVI